MQETQVLSSDERHLCRLCMYKDEKVVDIFNGGTEGKIKPLVEKIFDLLQVKYEKSTVLPNTICHYCVNIVETFTKFRENVYKCENEFQRRLTNNQKPMDSRYVSEQCQTPGLNGNPGVFVPEANSAVIEVNPDMDFESSDDAFSMVSDSEPEDIATNTAMDVGQQQPTIKAPALSTGIDEVNAVKVTHIASTTEVDMFPQDTTPKNAVLCQYCDMAFTVKAKCNEHEKLHNVSAPYCCNFCALGTSSRQQLISHIKHTHDAERPYVCTQCSKGFVRRSDLRKHTIVHTGVRPFTCNVCTKSFSRNTNLTKHMRIHSGDKPHVCQLCPRSFTTAAELARHTNSHVEAKSKPYRCSRCTASFKRKDKLESHEQAHKLRDAECLINQPKSNIAKGAISSGVEILQRPGESQDKLMSNTNTDQLSGLPATSADNTYRQSILADHLQNTPSPKLTSSKQSRLFTCEICAKTFTREKDLQRHQALHLDMLFKCQECDIGFNRREKLQRHKQEHHTPQYPCKICRLMFTKQEDLEEHLKIHELQQQGNIAVPSGPQLQYPMREMRPPEQNSTAAVSFYSKLVPTMNLGFYSELSEDRNTI